jgi:Acetyltransferases, including N-acetylases of ribosomal proteins
MYYKKYESENLYLSPFCVDDYQMFTKWVNDESLASGLGNFKFNITELSEKEWIENVCKKGEYHFAVVRKADDKLLGVYGLEEKDNVSRRFHVGGFIGEKSNRGKGYGTEALTLITKFAFEILNAQSLFSGIFSFNEASVKSAVKAGYSISGKFREAYFYNGKFHDEICIEIIKADYNNLKK